MSLRIQWISAARGEKKGRFPFVTLKINWIGTDQPRWSFNTKNYVFDNFINFKTLWLGQKVVEILNLINRIIQTLLVRVLTVWNTSVFPEKYLLRNISVGGVVWDNSDKVWCNILEMKRMRSQGSHHHPLWTKKGDANMGFVLRGIIQLIQESICQLKSVLPFHFSRVKTWYIFTIGQNCEVFLAFTAGRFCQESILDTLHGILENH